jgi:predicted amidophosphoribosyltransferase
MSEVKGGNLADLWAVGGQQNPPDANNQWRFRFCPECGWQLTGKFSHCPRCGADLRLSVCPYCGGDIPSRLEQCPRCSAPFNGPLESKDKA